MITGSAGTLTFCWGTRKPQGGIWKASGRERQLGYGGSIASWKCPDASIGSCSHRYASMEKNRLYSCASLSMTRSARSRSSGTSPGEEMNTLRRLRIRAPLRLPRAPHCTSKLKCARQQLSYGECRNHMEEIASIDLFVVPTIAFQQLFAFLVLGHRRRQLLWFAVTQNPTTEWLARQITEAFPWDSAPKYLILDNDRAFGGAFKARVRAMGIRDRPTSFRSPWQNGHVERLIGLVRRECIDHLIVFNAEHLRRILAKYAAYYNEVRTHVSLGKDAPCTRPIERFGDIVAHPILGGLHHRYARI